MRTGKTFIYLSIRALSATAETARTVSSLPAEGASGFCQTMPTSWRQLMSIGASEHRTFVRAKARFAGQKAQEHSLVRGNAVFAGHNCHVSLAAFSGGKCRACLALPEVPASDLPVLIHSRWNASCPAWLSAASVAAGCESVFGEFAATWTANLPCIALRGIHLCQV